MNLAKHSPTDDLPAAVPGSSQASTSPMEPEEESGSSEEHGARSGPSTSTEMKASQCCL